jgi:hypothetical protein
MDDDKKVRCPNCRIPVFATMSCEQDGRYHLNLSRDDDRLSTLYEAFQRFLRWKAEGERPHGNTPVKSGEKTQYYYDGYHSHIAYDQAKDEYTFSIQVSDSPDGDTWWKGRFNLWGGCQIQKILEERTESY